MRLVHWRRTVLASAVLAVGLLVGPVAYTARASLTYCTSDPVVTLSNGVQVTMYETIYDTASDVAQIAYALHIPVGLSVRSISYSGAVPSSHQSVTVSADENPGNYDAYTVVSTGTPNMSVTAYLATNSTVSAQTAGHSGQTLHNHNHLS